MGIIKNRKFPKETLHFSLSRMLESASFYGLRALLVLYMIAGVLKMDDTQAILVYGWFSGSIIFSQVLGATLGDLLIGNKKSIIIGGLVQSAGAFILCLPSSYGLYIGLFLIVLGTGLFTPNIIANYGKSYLKSTQLLDAGFTLFFLVINIGSFIGILLIGYSGEKFGYTIGFIISGLLTLLSLIPILKTKENEFHQRDNVPFERRIINIVIALLIVGLFWGIYEISSFRIVDLQLKFSEISLLEISKSAWQSMSSIFVVPICLIAIIIWTFFYSSQFFKLLVGFISGAIAFGIILFIPEAPAANHTIYFFLALLFLAISEIHIAPIIHSILTKYSNPKYLAILISLAFVPPKLFALFFGLFNERLYDNPTLGIKLGTIAMVLVSIGLVGYIIIDKKATLNNG